VRIALLADIHANVEALDVCLDAARNARVDRYVFLGDLVGYGPDPVAVIDRVAILREAGAVVIQGNHDEAAAVTTPSAMSIHARRALDWTRQQLSTTHAAFLGGLPIIDEDGDRLYVHASAAAPGEWRYLHDNADAIASLAACRSRVTFCGHTHVPALFHAQGGRAPSHFRPQANTPVALSKLRRYIVVLGAVGQPRDRDPRACWGLYDTRDDTITLRREPYDVETTTAKIMAADLPEWLATRLIDGR
jgi:diadenosine tetraphosphatase ApaH/serine/threonine PP2A family protein phosphatase